MIDKLIFGSHAIKARHSDFREPKDIDYIDKNIIITKEEQHYWIPEFKILLDINKDCKYLDLDLLLTCKASHFPWDKIHWNKTMNDILFLKSKGYKVNKEVYNHLVKGWIKHFGKNWAPLKGKDSTTFFEDAVKRKYNHDALHEIVAVYDKPLYESLVFEGVSCSEKGFKKLSYEDKLLLVKEEIWVTALERFLIPNDFKYSQQLAYFKSFKKLASTMSSGWFRFFIIDNLENLYKNDDHSYIEKFKQAEKEGKIKLA